MDRIVGQKLYRHEVLDSTHHELKKLAQKGAPLGTVVVAGEQTSGRGQREHVWHSPPGGLYMSVLLRASSPQKSPELSLLAGVAVAQTISNCLSKQHEVALKWPNDCLLNGKKVAGVLSEYLSETRQCVVGIGINVNLPEREIESIAAGGFPATSFLIEDKGAYNVEDVFQALLRKLEGLYGLYKAEGFDSIHQLWIQNCPHRGRKIRFVPTGEASLEGVFTGIDPNGALMLSTSSGSKSYLSGSIECILP